MEILDKTHQPASSNLGYTEFDLSGETRNEVFELPKDAEYPLTVSTRVLYQVFAKGLTDKVRNAYPDENIPDPQVIELQKVEKRI